MPGTVFARASDLYNGYAWFFRLGGLLLLVGLVVVAVAA
ncbi:NADH:ubiquinone oxidoreductase subunit 6 (subunit J) [Nocardioides luteus]|nr:NADH:ubiquinone oxidoreductase subunit 6 (subunit J) [Nocardioides luteus]